jgi:hypothetical protein
MQRLGVVEQNCRNHQKIFYITVVSYKNLNLDSSDLLSESKGIPEIGVKPINQIFAINICACLNRHPDGKTVCPRIYFVVQVRMDGLRRSDSTYLVLCWDALPSRFQNPYCVSCLKVLPTKRDCCNPVPCRKLLSRSSFGTDPMPSGKLLSS